MIILYDEEESKSGLLLKILLKKWYWL